MPEKAKPVDAEVLRIVRHDIKNQLSNINLALAELKHDLENVPHELDYLKMIEESTAKIDSILKSTE